MNIGYKGCILARDGPGNTSWDGWVDAFPHRIRELMYELSKVRTPLFVQGSSTYDCLQLAEFLHLQSEAKGLFLFFEPQNHADGAHLSPGRGRFHEPDVHERLLLGDQGPETEPFPGLVHIARHGTLVIDQMQHLSLPSQACLARFLRSFQENDSLSRLPLRLVAICTQPPQELIGAGQLDADLAACFSSQEIRIPSLSKRKKDLPRIAEQIIRHQSQSLGKDIHGLTREALNALVTYDWPGNFQEFKDTLQRAVALTPGPLVRAEDIFWGRTPVQGPWTKNLMRIACVRKMFGSHWYPAYGQVLTGVFFAFILLAGIGLGGQLWANLSLSLTWGVWEPCILIGTLLVGRMWCALCPVRWFSQAVGSTWGLGHEVQERMQNLAPWVSGTGIALIIWSQEVWSLQYSAGGTALLIAGIAILAGVTAFWYQKMTWCRYMCPLRALLGVLARTSCTVMRAHHGLCRSLCPEHWCLRNPESICPMLKAPFAQQSNQHCILCGTCVRSCPHDSPEYRMRIPGYELSAVRSPTILMRVLVPIILGTQLFRWGVHVGPEYMDGLTRALILGLEMVVACLVAEGGVRFLGYMLLGTPATSGVNRTGLAVYALVPFLLGLELSLHIPMVADLGLGLISLSVAKQSVHWVQGLCIAGGGLWSLAVSASIRRRHNLSISWPRLLRPWAVALIGSGLFLLLL